MRCRFSRPSNHRPIRCAVLERNGLTASLWFFQILCQQTPVMDLPHRPFQFDCFPATILGRPPATTQPSPNRRTRSPLGYSASAVSAHRPAGAGPSASLGSGVSRSKGREPVPAETVHRNRHGRQLSPHCGARLFPEIKAGWVGECAAAPPTVTTADVSLTLERLAINSDGLDELDRRNLQTLTERHSGGLASLGTQAGATGDSANTLQDTVEPYLIQ